MRIRFHYLLIQTKRATERIEFADQITFIHGPVSTGKSTVARLIDYCLGGDLERTPAIQQEFVSVTLSVLLGNYECTIERSAEDRSGMRVNWSGPDNDFGSVNAPLVPQEDPLLDGDVYNFSDLIFYLCGVEPIKVRQRSRDYDSPLIRLSIRDILWYCYLEQTELDSSFFHLDEPFKGRKSQDALRFITGLHSERLNQIQNDLLRTIDQQQGKREAVKQIRQFMNRFDLGSEIEISDQLLALEEQLGEANTQREELQRVRQTQIHPTDSLRQQLRRQSQELDDLQQALLDTETAIAEQRALRAELITAKTKAVRADQATQILEGAQFERCPSCGSNLSGRSIQEGHCYLCGSYNSVDGEVSTPFEFEALRRDLNDRIDELNDSIRRRDQMLLKMRRQRERSIDEKQTLDRQLQEELRRYDSAFIETVRGIDREIATLAERKVFLLRLQQMPTAINDLEEQAGALQGSIDRLRTALNEERARLHDADANILAVGQRFKEIMLNVQFPGVSEQDEVIIDPRNWKPLVRHGQQEWGFWDAGSGGKKTLFNVCYALAIHSVALERRLPLPPILIIDSPTKNISEDENPELVRLLYGEIYRLATEHERDQLQFVLIDSDFVPPQNQLPSFYERRMAGQPDAPSLIPYYDGP